MNDNQRIGFCLDYIECPQCNHRNYYNRLNSFSKPSYCEKCNRILSTSIKTIMTPIKTGMTKDEFQEWKKSWFDRIPKCKDFACCHELMSCAIRLLCGCGSIYETYSKQENPEECTTIDCADCVRKYDCKKISGT